MTYTNRDKLIRLFQIFVAKLILEVFGGVGAIWGFSEVVGLRVPATVWFWRPCALTVGVMFFLRWVSQMQEYIVEEKVKVKFFEKSAAGDNEEQVSLAPQNGKVYSRI